MFYSFFILLQQEHNITTLKILDKIMHNPNNQKLLKTIVQKLKDGEIILAIEQVVFISLHNKKPSIPDTLVITTSCLYFYEDVTLRKYFKASAIKYIILTPYSNEMILNVRQGKQSQNIIKISEKEPYKESFLRLQSNSNVRIIKNILQVREKFMGMTKNSDQALQQQLNVTLVKDKTLQNYPQKFDNPAKGRSRLLSFILGAKNPQPKQNSSKSAFELIRTNSPQSDTFPIFLNNFALKIGQKMYEQIYSSTRLLYINSDQNFRFIQQNYKCQEIDSLKSIYWPKDSMETFNKTGMKGLSQKKIQNQNAQTNPAIMMRKIVKRNVQQNNFFISMLSSYKNAEYKEELKYVIETETHFQVLSLLNSNEENLEQIFEKQGYTFTEKDLRSVFIKMLEMIEAQPKVIFYSLSLENIRKSEQGGIKISSIFSSIQRHTQIDYIAPEQLQAWSDPSIKFQNQQIQLINLWKAGILIFQMAYGNVPFPIDVVINVFLENKGQITLNFPQEIFRTLQFKKFIQSILQIDPSYRGGQDNSLTWKQKIMKLQWMRFK